MRAPKPSLLIFCFLILDCDALNCRSGGGPKESELKKIYNSCMRQQDSRNRSNGRGDSEQDGGRKETRRYNQWSQDNRPGQARNRGSDNREHRTREWVNENERSGMENRNRDQNMRGQDRNSNSRDNKMQAIDRMYIGGGRDERQNRNANNRFENNNGVSARNDFFDDDFGNYNNQYSTQSSRRYKRERRVEMNSGKRSQYNPNSQRFSGYEERHEGEETNSSESNSTNDDGGKSCALHCLLDNLQMTGENGMPDRYLVTHAITKDVKDEDLKDFLQESIEECFQILYNENTDDKCEFSKNLLMCLSEKGRDNCDDWKDDFQFS